MAPDVIQLDMLRTADTLTFNQINWSLTPALTTGKYLRTTLRGTGFYYQYIYAANSCDTNYIQQGAGTQVICSPN